MATSSNLETKTKLDPDLELEDEEEVMYISNDRQQEQGTKH